MPNRLANEQSPYLLQHQDNPVDWYPWAEDAFARARREEKPIFLSVGYSTCHWCHVMAHESFESADVAAVLNRDFVSIKVDREERPDVDRVYMTFVQATTGSGGWPMSVWLTPTLEPFYGGTYYPPSSRWGRPGFIEVLTEVARAWREERDKVVRSASSIVERLRSFGARPGGAAVPAADVLSAAVAQFAQAFDARRGGFGDAPKFPRPSELLFLLREHARTGADAPRDMVLATLRAMALGAMRDHVGGGFHRYSVDGDWRVPHFEKMLYDQAQLVLAYVEAAQLTGDAFFADVAADTLAYVSRDLTAREGGFFSAEDADSVPPEHAAEPSPHKREGAFYVWRADEIETILGDDAEVFARRFGVEPGGNAPFDPQQEFVGQNLLYTAWPLEDVASATGQSIDAVQQALARSRARLLDARTSRPRPHLDDKILTAWNGLTIAAFARAGRVLGSSGDWILRAQAGARFARRALWREHDRTLLRRYRAGEAGVEGYAEDYAFLIAGLLELFQADGDAAWLDWALTLQQAQDERFADPAGGWFSTTGRDPSVLLRLKEEYDGAEPSASAVGVLNLIALAHLTGDDAMVMRAERTLAAFLGGARDIGRALPLMLAALSAYHAGTPQVVVVGSPEAPDTVHLLDAVRRRYRPTALVLPIDPQAREQWTRLLPWTSTLDARGGAATAYLCRDRACQTPTTSPETLAAQLDASAEG